MTREQTRKAAAVMLAWADGKKVQFRTGLSSRWEDVGYPDWNWLANAYRIKSAARLRPWTADEVPLGAWMRKKTDPQCRFLLTSTATDDSRPVWITEYEHSTDNGKTWLPCGVEEGGE